MKDTTNLFFLKWSGHRPWRRHKVGNGEELSDDLIASFVSATRLQQREEVSKFLAGHNRIDPAMRKALAPITMISAQLSVLYSPYDFSQDEFHAREIALIAAVGTVCLQALEEI